MTLVIDQAVGWASVEAIQGEVHLAVGEEYEANEYILHLTPQEAFKLGKALYRAGLLLGVKPRTLVRVPGRPESPSDRRTAPNSG